MRLHFGFGKRQHGLHETQAGERERGGERDEGKSPQQGGTTGTVDPADGGRRRVASTSQPPDHDEERQASQQPPAVVWSQEPHHDRPVPINCSAWSMAAWHAPRGGTPSGLPYLAFSQVSRREVARADASPLPCAESADSISAGVRPSAGTSHAPVRCLRTSALSPSNACLRPASVSRSSARTASSEACSSW